MSRCAGAGREQSQTASSSWQGEILHAIDVGSVYEWGLAGEQESALLVSVTSNPPWSRSSNFSGSSVFSRSFAKLAKFTFFWVPRSLLRDRL